MRSFRLFLLLLGCCAAGQLAGQTLYMQDGLRLVKKAGPDCALTAVLPELHATDIGYEGGEMYAITATTLFRLDLDTGGETQLFEAGSDHDRHMTGLTGDGNGHLYICGDHISRFTIATGEMEVLGTVPYLAFGDIVHWNGKLYVGVTVNGYPHLLKIVVATFTPSIVGELPLMASGLALIEGDNEKLYVSQNTSLGTVSMANATYTPVCNGITTSYISGMTAVPGNLGLSDAEPFTVGVYPNPASGVLTVAVGTKAAVELLDLSGKVLLTRPAGEGPCELSLTAIAAGSYLVRISAESGTVYRKVEIL